MIFQHTVYWYVKIYNTLRLLIWRDRRQDRGSREEGTSLEGVLHGGGGVDLIRRLRNEAFLNEGTDGGNVGVTKGRGLAKGAEAGGQDLLDVETLNAGQDVVDGPL